MNKDINTKVESEGEVSKSSGGSFVKILVSSTLVYSALAFLQPLISFALQPFYIDQLGNNDYGVFSTFNYYINFVNILGALSVPAAFFTFYYNYHQKQEDLLRFLGQILSFGMYASVVFLGLACLLGPWVFSMVFKSDLFLFYPYGIVATINGLAYNFYIPYVVYLRNKKQLWRYAAFILCITCVNTGLQIFLVFYANMGIVGGLLGKATGVSLGALVVLFIFRQHLSWRLNGEMLKPVFRYIKYVVPDSISRWGYGFVDKLIVERFLTTAILGQLNFLSLMAGSVEIAYFAVRGAIYPFLFEALAEEEKNKRQIKALYRFFISLSIICVAGIILIIFFLDIIITNEKILAIRPYTIPYATAFLFSSVSTIVFLEFDYAKNSLTVMRFNFLSLVLAFGFSLWLIPTMGLVGAVVSVLITRVSSMLALLLLYPRFFYRLNDWATLGYMLSSLLVFGLSLWVVYQQAADFHSVGLGQFVVVFALGLLFNRRILWQQWQRLAVKGG